MKILQINAVYGHGSTGTIVQDLSDLCDNSGIDCYVASPDTAVLDAKHGYLIGNTLDHKLHAFLSRFNGRQAYFSTSATKRLLSYIQIIKPDIVHLHNLHSNFINLNLLLGFLAKNNFRVIISLHDCWYYTGGCFHYTADGCSGWLNGCGQCPKGKQDPIGVLGKRTAENLADRKKFFLSIPQLDVVGVSDWISQEAKRTFFCDSHVLTIHNGVDMEVFKPTPSNMCSRLGLEGKYIILGPASKWLLPLNRPVLDYFANNMQSDEVLLLFGAEKTGANLPNNIRLFGFTNNRDELAALYSCADVFVNTTREDSLSLINVEAQACGTTVVTLDDTGPKETVDGVISRSVEVGNAERLYKEVVNVRECKTSNTGILSRRFVEKEFEIKSNYNKYIDLYKQSN